MRLDGAVGRRADTAYRWHLGPAWRPVARERLRALVQDRPILITGASSGIGAQCARLLGAAGADLHLLARREPLLEQVAQEVRAGGGRAHLMATDLRDEESVALAITALASVKVQIVVHSAGTSMRRSLAASADRWHDVTRTNGSNNLGPVQLLSGLLPGMRERGSGHLINIGTVSASLPVPDWSLYSATKAGFDAWLAAIAPEVRADGVLVSNLRFPLVHTTTSNHTYAGWPGLSVQVAAEVVGAAIVRQPRLLSPWWARVAAPVLDNAPALTDRVLGRWRG